MQIVRDQSEADRFRREWEERVTGIRLVDIQCHGKDAAHCLAEYALAGTTPEVETTLILPAPATESFRQRVRTWRELRTITAAPNADQHLSVVVVRDHGGASHVDSEGPLRILPRPRQTALILVERLDRSVLNAIEYARATGTMQIRALHAAIDPAKANELFEQWLKLATTLGIQLDIENCPDRNIPRTVRTYIERLQAPDMEYHGHTAPPVLHGDPPAAAPRPHQQGAGPWSRGVGSRRPGDCSLPPGDREAAAA